MSDAAARVDVASALGRCRRCLGDRPVRRRAVRRRRGRHPQGAGRGRCRPRRPRRSRRRPRRAGERRASWSASSSACRRSPSGRTWCSPRPCWRSSPATSSTGSTATAACSVVNKNLTSPMTDLRILAALADALGPTSASEPRSRRYADLAELGAWEGQRAMAPTTRRCRDALTRRRPPPGRVARAARRLAGQRLRAGAARHGPTCGRPRLRRHRRAPRRRRGGHRRGRASVRRPSGRGRPRTWSTTWCGCP